MSDLLVVLGLLACAVSGVPALFLCRNSCTGQRITTVILVAGCVLGLAGVCVYWHWHDSAGIALEWPIAGGRVRVGMDGLSALFLAPIFLIALLAGIYGLSYWKQSEHPANGRKLGLFFGLLPAGMALLVIAQNGLVFLVGWEIMALAAFFLVTTEEHDKEVRAAGYLYIVATHFSTLCLFAVFGLLYVFSGDSFDLKKLSEDEAGPNETTALYVLALIGFGIKAGLMPLHVWLPSAHAMAPSHVSAMMSGVLIKMGVYGFVRVSSLLPAPSVEWGVIILALGVISGVLGVAYAIGQHDLKRLLAYHSIENIGIIFMGIGLAVLGRSMGRPDWIVLGLCGGLLHVWNHALFKSLLFLSAGAVIHATHTREIDHLGGLAKLMPRTALCFLIGAVAICGLPPLNGFVSEFLIYVGLFRTLGLGAGPSFAEAALAVPALALIGGLALACFVKVFGAVFLGSARSHHAALKGHEPNMTMVGPMLVLAGGCFFIGLAPAVVAPLLMKAAQAWAPEVSESNMRLETFASFDWISLMGTSLLGAILLTGVLLWNRLRNSSVETGPTWGCGYAAPTARMQYTASSFAEMLVGIFSWVLRTRRRQPEALPLFPQQSSFHSETRDAVLEEGILPTFRFSAWLFSWIRIVQHGNMQMRLLYIFLTLVFFLLWR